MRHGAAAQQPGLEWWRPQPAVARAEASSAAAPAAPGTGVPFWSLMGFTVVLLFAPQSYIPALATLRPAFLLAGLGIGFYVYDRWSRRQPIVVWTRELRLVSCLALWAAAGIPFSIWPGGSFALMADNFVKTLAIFWLLSHVAVSAVRLRQVAWSLTVMAVGLSAFAVYNYLTGAVIEHQRLLGNEGSLTKNPNDMALMINLIVPLTVGLFLSSKEAHTRAVLLAAIGLEAVTVVLTYSRAGALTLGLIFFLYFWKLRRRPERKLFYAVLVAGVLALPLLPSTYFDRLGTITDIQADRTGSAQERWADMVIAMKKSLTNPIKGYGIGMNVLTMNEERQTWRAVHNVYLELALDLGFPGLVLFLMLLSACIQGTLLAQRRSRPGTNRALFHMAEGVQVSLIAYAVAAMFHPVSYHFYFYYIAGLAVAVRRLSAAEETVRA